METLNIKAYTVDSSQIKAIKAFFKALDIKIEVLSEKSYNPDFVEKILEGDKDFDAGKGKKVTIDELDNLWK
jgi:cytochrome c